MRKNKIQPNIKFLGSKNLKKFQNIHHFGGGGGEWGTKNQKFKQKYFQNLLFKKQFLSHKRKTYFPSPLFNKKEQIYSDTILL